MKRTFPVLVLLGALAAFAPAHAATTGCQTIPMQQPSGDPQYDESCSYTATGFGEYLAATPDHWSITVYHVNPNGSTTVVYEDAGEAGAPGAPKQLPAEAGDRVVVIQGSDCLPSLPACGEAGIVAAYEPHS